MNPLERTIQHDIRMALGLEPDLVLWRNTTGHAVEFDRRGAKREYDYGLCKGSADLIGCLAGRFVALEVKRPGEQPTDDQVAFGNVVRFNGGFFAVVRSVDEARAAIARARNGSRS